MLQPDEVRGYAKYFLYHFFNGTSVKIVLLNLEFFFLKHNSLGGGFEGAKALPTRSPSPFFHRALNCEKLYNDKGRYI